jgi:hypothetical protein
VADVTMTVRARYSQIGPWTRCDAVDMWFTQDHQCIQVVSTLAVPHLPHRELIGRLVCTFRLRLRPLLVTSAHLSMTKWQRAAPPTAFGADDAGLKDSIPYLAT